MLATSESVHRRVSEIHRRKALKELRQIFEPCPKSAAETSCSKRQRIDSMLRTCLRDPIPEIAEAARLLNEAASAHLAEKRALADELIRRANMPAIKEWTESLWGKKVVPFSRPLKIENAPRSVPKAERIYARMPGKAGLTALIQRDGLHCRFCGIPVIRAEVRTLIQRAYPEALPWAPGNANQHAGFQALWLTYDHLLPHSEELPKTLNFTINSTGQSLEAGKCQLESLWTKYKFYV